jgi:putative SOS response-associated peptidase YedK
VTRSFAIIIMDASPDLAKRHDRMPVILAPADWQVWLGEAPSDPASLLHPSPAATLRVWHNLIVCPPSYQLTSDTT